MNIEDTNAVAQVVRSNRFHFQSKAIHALGELFEETVPWFNKGLWLSRITGKPWQPKTGLACGCSPGQHRDNCPDCEGTGMKIDFAAIRSRAVTSLCGKRMRKVL